MKYFKKRILALLLTGCMLVPSVLSEPVHAQNAATEETENQESKDSNSSAEGNSTTPSVNESGEELNDIQKETDKGATQQESTVSGNGENDSANTPDESNVNSDESVSDTEKKEDSFTVHLNDTENGSLVFPFEEEPVMADENDPMKAMEEAIAQMERQEEKRDKTVKAGDEVSIRVASAYGYELSDLAAIVTDTGEEIQKLECDEKGELLFTMPDMDVTISAEFAEIKISDKEKEEIDVAKENASVTEKKARKASRAAASKSIGLNVGATVWYGAYLTNYFTTSEGFYAYCLEPKRATPYAGTYTASLVNNSYVRKAAFYSYGGPGYSTYKARYGNIGDGSQQYEYCYSHVVLSYIFAKYYVGSDSEANYAFLGLDEYTKQALLNVANNMMSMSAPPATYSCYYMNTSYTGGNGWTQSILCQTYNQGSLKLKKSSSNPSISANNKLYSLAGAVYGVYTDSGCSNQVTTFTTDANGNSNTVNLDAGTYFVKEKTAPKGFVLNKEVKKVTVVSSQTVTVNVSDTPINDPAAITISKIDAETGEKVQGAASLAGAQFTLKYYDGLYTKTNLPKKATRTWVIETQEKVTSSGEIKYYTRLHEDYKVSGDALYYQNGMPTIPRGTLTIEETKAPEGYNNNLVLEDGNGKTEDSLYLVQIQKAGDVVSLTGGNTFKGQDTVVRGDFSFTKVNGKTNEVMANIPFRIYCKETGQEVIVRTDENGYFSSQSSYAKHSYKTNSGEVGAGIWFGDTDHIDDNVGALPYGSYYIEELECNENIGLKMFTGEFVINENETVFDFGKVVNNSITIDTKVYTNGYNSTGFTGVGLITDTVKISGMSEGYVELTLMDKETGETLTDETGDIIKGGTVVTKSSEAGIDGEASPSLTLSEKTLADLRGKSIVCCVKLYKRNADGTPDYSRIYAVHNDIEDADETLPFAKVVTELTEKETGHHEVLLKNSDTVLTDTVKFENLPKKGFSSNMKITGTLVNASGSPVKAEDGTPIQDTISVSETEDFSKTYTLEYTIPSSILRKYEGKSMHSFVEVKMGEEIWTYEKDTKNAAQSITIPTIKETQTDKDILVSKDTGITDLVKMEGLIKGNTYTLVGKIVDKANGKVIQIDGEELSSSRTFTAEESVSEQEVHFNFEPEDLRGKGYVVFEYLYLGDGKTDKMLANNKASENLLMDGIRAFGNSLKGAVNNLLGKGTIEETKAEESLTETQDIAVSDVEESPVSENTEAETGMDADKESSEKKNAEEEDLKEVRADTETPEEKESENMDETETVVDPDDPSVVYSMPEKKNNPSLFEKAGNAAGSLFDAAKAKTKLFIEEAAKMSESDIQEGLGRTVIKDFIDFEETGTAAYTYRQILKDQKSDITSMLPVSLPIQTEDGEQSMAVTWECDDDVIHTEYDEYTFYPKWNDSYVLSAELQKQYDDAEITLPFVTVKILPSVTAPIDEKTSNTILEAVKAVEKKITDNNFTYKEIRDELLKSGYFYETFGLIGNEGRAVILDSLNNEELKEFADICVSEFAEDIPKSGADIEEVSVAANSASVCMEVLNKIKQFSLNDSGFKKIVEKTEMDILGIINSLISSDSFDEFKTQFFNAYGYDVPAGERKQPRGMVAVAYGDWAGPGPSYFRTVTEIFNNGDNGSGYNLEIHQWVEVKSGSSFGGTALTLNFGPKRVNVYGSGQYYALTMTYATVPYGGTYSCPWTQAEYTGGTWYGSGCAASWKAPNPIYNLTVNYYSNGATSVNGKPATSSNQYLGNYVYSANKTSNHYNFSTWKLQRTGYIGTKTWGTTTTGGYIQGEDTNMLGRDMAKGLGVDISKGHKSVNVYAIWKPISYFVQYDGNGATSGTTEKSSHTYDAAKPLSKNGFSRPGYAFAGWAITPEGDVVYTDEQSAKNLTTTNGATVTLYAKWVPLCTMDISLNVNGIKKDNTEGYFAFDVLLDGELVADNVTDYYNTEVPYGTKYEIADIDTFPDVRYDENSSESTGTISGSKEVVLNCFTQYQIIFNGNGSTIGYMSPRSSWYDSPIVLPNNQFQKTGYIFDGWNTEPDGSGVYYADTQTITKPLLSESESGQSQLILYAQWLDPNLSNTHNSLQDEKQSFYVPEIVKTVLTTAEGEKFFSPSGTGTLVDTITYSGLSSHIEYTIKGQLVNKDTGAVVEETSMKFTPNIMDGSEGTVQFEYVIDKSKYAGVTLVSYQTLYADVMEYGKPTGKLTELTSEKDINNADQTVTCMQIDTYAKDKSSGTKIISPNSNTIVQDTVTYQGAVTGTMYCLEATLMDKYREEPAKDKTGKVIMKRAFFTADASSGSVDVEIAFDSTELHSGEYVVFERLYELKLPGAQQIFYTAHEDYNDADQTVYIAGLDTNIYNTDNRTNVAYPSKNLTVRDIISYKGFLTDKTYTIEWSLYDTDTKKVYQDASGNKVTKTQTFKPTSMNGEFELETTFDASKLNGKALTAVANIKLDGATVLQHNTALDNEYETLLFPEVTTKAFDTRNKTQEAMAIKNASVTDQVSYTRLQAGMGHIIKTTLVDKSTGNVLKDAKGKDLIFTEEFKPTASEGSYDVVLEFDATNLIGKTAVVYQEIFMGENIVAQHKDINAESQTLTFTGVGETKASVTKRIRAKDFYETHGDVSFIFKMTGEDLSGETHTFYEAATFTEEYVKANTGKDGWVEIEVIFDEIPCGVYIVTESDVSRYHLVDIQSDSKEVKVFDDHAVYTLETINDTEYPTSIFTNEKYEWQDYSDSTMVINNFTTPPIQKELKAFAVYSADDQSLNFYKRYEVPEQGSQFEGKTVTDIYIDIEFITNGNWGIPWYDIRENIQSVKVVDEIAPLSCEEWFGGFNNATSIDVSKLNTSNVTNMDRMFVNCRALQTLDLSQFDTSNVTSMENMFSYCETLQSLDLSQFDTSNVTSMEYMFNDCYSLHSLDVSNFNTSKVTNMYRMFEECSVLQTLDLSSFDTPKVTDMYSMFSGCGMLQTLNVSNFDTSKVTDMRYMFNSCSALQTLDLSNFDVSNVTNMKSMFANCSNLKSIKTPKNIKTPYMDYITSKTFYDASDNYKKYPSGTFPKNITESHTLVVNAPYRITYDVNGGTMPSNYPTEYFTDLGLSALPIPTKPGYEFEGWFERTGSRDANLSLVSGSEWQMQYDGSFGLGLPCPDGGEGYHSSEFTFEMPEDGQVSFNMSLIMQGGRVVEIESMAIDGKNIVNDVPMNLSKGQHTFSTSWYSDGGYCRTCFFQVTTVAVVDEGQYFISIPVGTTGNKQFLAKWRAQK